jgi:uncharacterized protein YndB with AHSA1/START domain
VDGTTVLTEDVIERELRIAARPETVFAFWTDPELMARWMGRDVRLDPRPGGEYRIDYNGRDIARGSFVELDPPHRLVMTWGWEALGDRTPPGASTVEVTLVADGDGTLLHLRHTGLPTSEIAGHAQGWDQFLLSLAEAATAG